MKGEKEMNKCCICGKIIKGYGNNPYPLDKTEGAVCCDECNMKVIEARLMQYSRKLWQKKRR